LAIDPNSNGILFFGARSGNGLWKSTNFGATWSKVTGLTDTGQQKHRFFQARSRLIDSITGSYIADPTDTTGYNSDKVGIAWVTFDKSSGSSGSATPRIFVGVANKGSTSIYVTNNGGGTCKQAFKHGPNP
jgi:xyloglucan-specific exo-beta-1,4-glucanase